MKDKLKQGIGSATFFVLLLAVLLVLNLISVNLFGRIDLTEGNVYSLSKTSKDVVRNLNDRLIIKMYFSKDLPPPYSSNMRYLKDQLEEYQAYSNGKLKLELIHPDDPEKELEAQKYGIPPLQVKAMQNDKIEIKKVYMGMVLLFEDRKEVVPVFQNVTDLEYELSSTIRRISYKMLPSISYLIGKGEPDLNTEISLLNQELSRYYKITKTNIDAGYKIPKLANILMILGPKKALSEWEKFSIDQFIMQGGRLVILLDNYNVDIRKGIVEKQDLGIENFLANYGIKINRNLVTDMQCNQIMVTQQQGAYTVSDIINYPFFPTAVNFDKNSLIVKDLEGVTFNFVSSLDSSSGITSRHLRFNPIVWSSDKSRSETEPFDINPLRQFRKEDFTQGPQILAATVQGSFRSYYADWDRSQIEEKIGYVDSVLTEGIESRIVVVGNANFIVDQNLKGNDNLTFFLNIIDWLYQDEAMVNIRSKQVTSRPLKEISSGARKLIKYGNIFGLPFLVIVFGVIRWQLKKQIKRKAG